MVDMKNTSMSAKLCLKGDSQTSGDYCAYEDNERTVLLANIVTTMIQTHRHLRVDLYLIQISVHVQYYDLTVCPLVRSYICVAA